MKRTIAILFFVLLLQFCSAAVIQGKVFDWDTLQSIGNAVIDINSSPPQRVVTENGNYGFTVPTGDYSVIAMQFIDGKLARIAKETVIVENDGEFTFDIILRRATEEDLAEMNGDGLGIGLFQGWGQEELVLGIGFLAVAIAAAAYLYFWKKNKKIRQENEKKETGQGTAAKAPQEEETPEPEKPMEKPAAIGSGDGLDSYAREVLDALQRSGNRLTQKELRAKVESIGEAKISLILTELETMGKIKKIKKGRGNIIILKEQ